MAGAATAASTLPGMPRGTSSLGPTPAGGVSLPASNFWRHQPVDAHNDSAQRTRPALSVTQPLPLLEGPQQLPLPLPLPSPSTSAGASSRPPGATCAHVQTLLPLAYGSRFQRDRHRFICSLPSQGRTAASAAKATVTTGRHQAPRGCHTLRHTTCCVSAYSIRCSSRCPPSAPLWFCQVDSWVSAHRLSHDHIR